VTFADVGGLTESVVVAEGDWWRLSWNRHKTPLPPDAHGPALAWMSDGHMVNVVKKPHGSENFGMSMSLDHSIHFHRPFRADEWLLFHMRTTVSSGSRGLARTEIFSSQGHLVATVTQEALVRPKQRTGATPGLPVKVATGSDQWLTAKAKL